MVPRETPNISEDSGMHPLVQLCCGKSTHRIFPHFHRQTSSRKNNTSDDPRRLKEARHFTKNGAWIGPDTERKKSFRWSTATCASSITTNRGVRLPTGNRSCLLVVRSRSVERIIVSMIVVSACRRSHSNFDEEVVILERQTGRQNLSRRATVTSVPTGRCCTSCFRIKMRAHNNIAKAR
jgi:hypothetical protein